MTFSGEMQSYSFRTRAAAVGLLIWPGPMATPLARTMRSRGTGAAVALSRLLMVTGLAPVIGPIIGGQLLRVWDWRVLFLALAAASAAASA